MQMFLRCTLARQGAPPHFSPTTQPRCQTQCIVHWQTSGSLSTSCLHWVGCYTLLHHFSRSMYQTDSIIGILTLSYHSPDDTLTASILPSSTSVYWMCAHSATRSRPWKLWLTTTRSMSCRSTKTATRRQSEGCAHGFQESERAQSIPPDNIATGRYVNHSSVAFIVHSRIKLRREFHCRSVRLHSNATALEWPAMVHLVCWQWSTGRAPSKSPGRFFYQLARVVEILSRQSCPILIITGDANVRPDGDWACLTDLLDSFGLGQHVHSPTQTRHCRDKNRRSTTVELHWWGRSLRSQFGAMVTPYEKVHYAYISDFRKTHMERFRPARFPQSASQLSYLYEWPVQHRSWCWWHGRSVQRRHHVDPWRPHSCDKDHMQGTSVWPVVRQQLSICQTCC